MKTQTAANLLRKLYLICRAKNIPVDPVVAAIAIRSVGDYVNIRNTYVATLRDAIEAYLAEETGLGEAKGKVKTAMSTAFLDAFETGYLEGQGGTQYEPEPDDSSWLAARQSAELGYIDTLFQSLKEIKDDPDVNVDEMLDYANDRIEGYARTLDGVYAQGKLRGKKNIMLTLDGSDGEESCATCQKYKLKRHRAKWWVSHDLVPSPGNENYECGGYRCQHQLFDDQGNVWAGSLS